MTHKNTWKASERRIATFFNTERTPLSGGNSKMTRSDTLHDKLFIEAKLRVKHATMSLWRETKELAKKEGKIPVICLAEKNKPGFLVCVHCDDMESLIKEIK